MSEKYTTTLGEMITLQRGYDLTAKQRNPGSVPVIGGGGANGFHDASKMPGPGVVVARSGSGMGNAWWVDEDYWPHNTVLFVKDFKENYPRYVFYVLDLIDFSIHNTGGAQPSLNRNFIYPLPVFLPPLPEQRKIAAILRTWDEAIEKLEKLLDLKKRRHKAILNGVYAKSQSEWSQVELGKHLRERSEKSCDQDQYPCLTSSRQGMFFQSDYFTRDVSSKSNVGYKVMRRGEFTFRAMSDDGVFMFNRLDIADVGIISPAYAVFAPHDVDSDFLLGLLNSEFFAFQAFRHAQGGTRLSLKYAALSKIQIGIPNMETQKKIAALIRGSNADIAQDEKLITAIRAQKRGLMQKLLTGEWPVETEQEEVVA